MHIGEVQVLLNHPRVFIGPAGELEDFVETPLTGPMPVEFSHIAVPARAQVSTVSVRIWSGAHPSTGMVVFSSSLELPRGDIAIFDVDGLSRFVRTVGRPGRHHLTIRVDDPVRASRVDVVVDSGPDKATLNRVPGYRLPEIEGVSGELSPPDTLHMILSGVSSPKARLVTALDLVISEWESSDSPRHAQVNSFRLRLITEWLKGVYPEVESGFWHDVSVRLEAEVADAEGPTVGGVAVSIAQRIIALAEESSR